MGSGDGDTLSKDACLGRARCHLGFRRLMGRSRALKISARKPTGCMDSTADLEVKTIQFARWHGVMDMGLGWCHAGIGRMKQSSGAKLVGK